MFLILAVVAYNFFSLSSVIIWIINGKWNIVNDKHAKERTNQKRERALDQEIPLPVLHLAQVLVRSDEKTADIHHRSYKD
jgi:hypothetical protein